MDPDPIAEAYAWGASGADLPRDEATDRGRLEQLMRMSPEERRAAVRGFRDAGKAIAPLPLPFTLAFHATWIAVISEVEGRGGRWRYVPAGAVLLGLTKLRLDAIARFGKSRARSAGIERHVDAPDVPKPWTTLWVGVMIPVQLLRRLLGHPPRKQTRYEMGAAPLALDLVEWWAWRPYLSRSRRRAAPPA